MEHLLGYIAATLTTVCFIPQAYHTMKTRDTSGLSKSMYILFCLGLAFWLAYGLMISSPPIIIGNIITLTLALIILFHKLKEKKPDGEVIRSDRE